MYLFLWYFYLYLILHHDILRETYVACIFFEGVFNFFLLLAKPIVLLKVHENNTKTDTTRLETYEKGIQTERKSKNALIATKSFKTNCFFWNFLEFFSFFVHYFDVFLWCLLNVLNDFTTIIVFLDLFVNYTPFLFVFNCDLSGFEQFVFSFDDM